MCASRIDRPENPRGPCTTLLKQNGNATSHNHRLRLPLVKRRCVIWVFVFLRAVGAVYACIHVHLSFIHHPAKHLLLQQGPVVVAKRWFPFASHSNRRQVQVRRDLRLFDSDLNIQQCRGHPQY